METKIQFQKNANVIAADGQPVGYLDRVVFNPETMVVTDIVVRTGALFNKEDKVVPIDFIADTTADQVILREEAGELAAFAPFEEEHIVDPEGESGERPSSAAEAAQPLIYGSPVLGTSMQPAPWERTVTRIDQNIPAGTIAMREGARVVTADGKHVGSVERVLTDPGEEQITYLLVSVGKFTKKAKLVPSHWVKQVNEDEVELWVYKVSVDELADATIQQ